MPVYGESLPTHSLGRGYLQQSMDRPKPVPIAQDGTLAGTDIYPDSPAARLEAKLNYEAKLAATAARAKPALAREVRMVPAFPPKLQEAVA